MTYKDLLANIDKGENLIYLLYGEESYIIEKIIEEIKDKLDTSFKDLNFVQVDEVGSDIDKIIETLESMPFMDTKRIVLLRSPDFFKTGGKGLSKTEEEKILNYIGNPSKSTVLVFAPKELDKRSATFKAIKKNHIIFESKKLTSLEIRRWSNDVLKNHGATMDGQQLDFFLERSGYFYKESPKTLRDVENELIKLSSIFKEKKSISKEDIEAIVFENYENDIFKFIDYVFMGNTKNSLRLFRDLTQNGESPLMVLTMIGRQLSMITKCHLLKGKGYNQSMIAQKLSVHPYALKKAMDYAQKVNFKDSVILMNLCVDTDFRIKTGQLNENIAVELIITKIWQKIKNEIHGKTIA